MQDLKAKRWSWWSRAALAVIALAGATMGALLCHLALSGCAPGEEWTTCAIAGQDGRSDSDLRHTGVLTFTPVATACLPIVLNGSGPVTEPISLAAVNDFLYQLQDLDLAAIGDTAYDLVVMDYSADGTEAGEFTPAQITALKHSPGGAKIVLAYMSIGEAEDYRFYWQEGWTPGNPAWLDAENPDWPGNYKVRYWDPGWQSIISGYTDRLLDAGFDGAYLDIIDAYEYYADRGRTTAAQEMVDFVAAIRAHARARDPDFYVFPQNAPQLAEEVPAYLGSVDGIGQEDIYYGYDDDDVMTPPAVTAELEGYLDVFKNAGKLVLTVDYATTPAHVDDAYARSQAKGYVPFVTVRDLDRLTINPGHEPD
jgi:cysteinyl-tRNA synthetase